MKKHRRRTDKNRKRVQSTRNVEILRVDYIQNPLSLSLSLSFSSNFWRVKRSISLVFWSLTITHASSRRKVKWTKRERERERERELESREKSISKKKERKMDSTRLGFDARPVISAPMQKRKSIRATIASDTDDWRHIQFIHRDARNVLAHVRHSLASREWRAGFWYITTRPRLSFGDSYFVSCPLEHVNRLLFPSFPTSAISGPLSFVLAIFKI